MYKSASAFSHGMTLNSNITSRPTQRPTHSDQPAATDQQQPPTLPKPPTEMPQNLKVPELARGVNADRGCSSPDSASLDVSGSAKEDEAVYRPTQPAWKTCDEC